MAGRVAHGNLPWTADENPDLPLGYYHHRALRHGRHRLVEEAGIRHDLVGRRRSVFNQRPLELRLRKSLKNNYASSRSEQRFSTFLTARDERVVQKLYSDPQMTPDDPHGPMV